MTRNDRRTRTVALTAALLVILAGSGTSLVAATAATSIEIGIDPSTATVEEGEQRTFDIVATGVDGGVGAGEIAAHVSDASVATITDVELRGAPGMSDVSANADNSTVEMLYVMADTNETGTVTIAEVTVLGTSNGTIEVSAGSVERNEGVRLFDETGERYGTVDASPVEIVVESPDDREPDTDSGSGSGTPHIGAGSSGSSSNGSPTDDSGGETTGDANGSESDKTSDSGDDGSNVGTTDNTSDEDDSDTEGSGEESDPTTTRTDDNGAGDETALDDAEAVDQVGFGVVPAIIAILVAMRLANRRSR
ncbi:MAG: hypothetical protein ACQET5_06565 [Halobacteriota archaeon]|uniref:hypothetical protein n=1 Tax=Natronomonas sp. TaxID=2184060 RepID=UPI003976A220